MRPDLFKNKNCSFRPFAVTTVGEELYPVGYKVVTDEYMSLGLRGNVGDHTPPTMRTLNYKLNSWQELPADMAVSTRADWGGIWCARTPGNARALLNYYERRHGSGRILVCAMKEPLFTKPDRVKCRGVYPIDEVNLLR